MTPTRPRSRKGKTAEEMADAQRVISVSEFFLRNRHLLGFDSPSKALVTAVREALDNALDACEEASLLPEVSIELDELDEHRYLLAVEDNGPGIVDRQIARIFGKLLYGSKFHLVRQSRGQQGMGISAAGMYAQLTTGEPMRIKSRIARSKDAHELVVSIDTAKNRPDIHTKRKLVWDKPHGTRIEMILEGHYAKGPHSIDALVELTAIANPHVTLHFTDPKGQTLSLPRSSRRKPRTPPPIKPHPHGVELGTLIQMLRSTKSRGLRSFLVREFSSVGPKTANEIISCAKGKLTPRSVPTRIAHLEATRLHRAIAETAISAPPSNVVVPIGEARLLEGLRRIVEAKALVAVTRPPAVYRGHPFVVELALAWSPSTTKDPARVLRFANRSPLLYQASSCAITKAIMDTNWRIYGLDQASGGLPLGSLVIAVHLASVWVPFTSESKEAIQAYPEILHEIVLGLREAGRRLSHHVRRHESLVSEGEKLRQIERYLPHVGAAISDILSLDEPTRTHLVERLNELVERDRRR